ncbi:MAG: iron ABC transporter substrate-binding protein [Solirubrobacteraceae bacterium]|nr:iron ABC transporter substrate-binding protein [Solirubrobacteraceae bacterium]
MYRKLSLAFAVGALMLAGCGDDDDAGSDSASATADTGTGALTVYSGRDEELVAPLIERYERETGNEVEVRYGDTAELASTIVEEGDNSPADVFFGQDAGALGALQNENRLIELDSELLDSVPAAFRSAEGNWVGTSARARIIAYDTRKVQQADLPESILDLTDEEWKGRVGWAPTNGSFQSFITALRLTEGDDDAKAFVEGLKDNDAEVYDGNTAIRDAISNGEVEIGLINHYYVAAARDEEGDDYPVGIHQPAGDIGSLVNIAGAGVLASSDQQNAATEFVRYLLSENAQKYFADETFEYPVSADVPADDSLTPLADIDQPDVDLSKIDDLQGTVKLLQDAGVL